MRRQFTLPGHDVTFLDSRGHPWEAILEGGTQWVLIENYDLPTGYNVARASIALRIQAMYPDVQIDMAYFSPHLARADGKVINALTPASIDGKQWQQWSRHRPQGNGDWQIGVDNIERHLLFVRAFLDEELRKR
jgi:hypothetical protein